jgi:hypothetical protein
LPTLALIPQPQESFLEAITDLELEQLHVESSRLQNSIFHLERSNIALEEFRDDEDCRQAIQENVETIARQNERVQMIKNEVERRGFLMPCGERKEDEEGGMDTEEGARAASGESVPTHREASTAQPAASVNGHAAGDINGTSQNEGESDREEEGVYL